MTTLRRILKISAMEVPETSKKSGNNKTKLNLQENLQTKTQDINQIDKKAKRKKTEKVKKKIITDSGMLEANGDIHKEDEEEVGEPQAKKIKKTMVDTPKIEQKNTEKEIPTPMNIVEPKEEEKVQDLQQPLKKTDNDIQVKKIEPETTVKEEKVQIRIPTEPEETKPIEQPKNLLETEKPPPSPTTDGEVQNSNDKRIEEKLPVETVEVSNESSMPPPPVKPKEDVVPAMQEYVVDADAASKPRPPPRSASKRCPGNRENDKPERKEKKKRKRENQVFTKVNFNWVMCDRCEKWRQIPGDVDVDALGKASWYCEMNKWDPSAASCDVPESDGNTTAPINVGKSNRGKKSRNGIAARASLEDDIYTVGGGKPRRGGKKGKPGRHANPERIGSHRGKERPRINSQSGGDMLTLVKQTSEWVMCETCQQWRKLPLGMDVNELPDKWYCSMNTWDATRASCSAPQEADDQKILARQQEEQAAYRNQVRLPEGVNLYGGQMIAGSTSNRKVPTNYRELIVNHYRHFKNWDQVSNSMCNSRYGSTSLFVPRGNSRRSRKRKQLISPSSMYNVLLRDSLFESTLVSCLPKEDFHTTGMEGNDENHMETQNKRKSLEELCAPKGVDGNGTGISFLKLSKPWKRVGCWQKGDTFTCIKPDC